MRKDALANREALLDSAIRLIIEKGAEVSLREIAREAGVGVATANRNFPDREALLLAVLEKAVDRLTAIFTPDAAAWEADPWEAWRDTIHGVREANLAGLAEQLLGQDTLVSSSFGDEDVKRTLIHEIVSRFFELGVHHGFVSADLDPVRFYMGVVISSRTLPAAALELDPHAREWLVDTYIAGLRADAETGRSI